LGVTLSVWHPFTVNGETYYWTAYPSSQKTGDGPWEPMEYLTVSRQPDTPGVGWPLPQGTQVTEAHAVELVRLVHADGRRVP
jgi:hypothetical protein